MPLSDSDDALLVNWCELTVSRPEGKGTYQNSLPPSNPIPAVPHAARRLDDKYKLLRFHLPTRKTFFDDLRALTRYLYFENWDHLLTFMLESLELEIPPNTS